MKAQNLSISVPNLGCEKNCPYCISKMTGYMDSNFDLMKQNLNKVLKYAELAQVSNITFTSKGEPLYSIETQNMLYDLMKPFKDFVVEIQTNGVLFLEGGDLKYIISGLELSGVNIIAISIDKFSDITKYKKVIETPNNIIWRATVNLTSMIKGHSFIEIVNALKETGFRQVSFREITVPNFGMVNTREAEDTFRWISNNVITPEVSHIKTEMDYVLKVEGRVIRKLPYGATLYEYNGLSITYFEYCIQDTSGEDDIRSLIFQEDGHLYTTWNSKASIIF